MNPPADHEPGAKGLHPPGSPQHGGMSEPAPSETSETSEPSCPPAGCSSTTPCIARTALCGMAMGLADAVPGVSGGTVALILGIYTTLIDSLSAMLHGLRGIASRAGRAQLFAALRFLLPLGIGAAVSLVTALRLLVGSKPEIANLNDAQLLQALANAKGLLINPSSAPIVFAFFFGLVAASVNEPWRHKAGTKGIDWALAAAGAAVSAGLVLSPAAALGPHPVLVMMAGAIAISVMLLPGISGSLALLVLGMYQVIAAAVHDRDLVIVGCFLLGMGLGLMAFVPILRRVLARAHDRTMSVLSGLMAGSLVALWPWKAHYLPDAIARLGPMQPITPSGLWWWCIVSAIIGAALIVVSSRFARARQQ